MDLQKEIKYSIQKEFEEKLQKIEEFLEKVPKTDCDDIQALNDNLASLGGQLAQVKTDVKLEISKSRDGQNIIASGIESLEKEIEICIKKFEDVIGLGKEAQNEKNNEFASKIDAL